MSTRTVALLTLLGALTTLGAPGCGGKVSDAALQIISVEDAQTSSNRSASTLLLDARDAEDFAKGHAKGAQHITPLMALDPAVHHRLSSYRNLIVYADADTLPSATIVAKRLLAARVSKVVLMRQGIEDWVAAGGELEIPQQPE